ncbi:MAG: hypothetical protein M3Y04_07865 [Actinomycetota bacterium]|nr:hypothetical protein [Actinomycetota bacterium]
MTFRWRSTVAGIALALTACGGGGGGGGSSADPVSPAPRTGRVTDSGAANTVVIEQADLPAPWKGAAHSADPSEKARALQIATCLGRPDPETTRSAIVYGPDMTLDQAQVSSIATVLNTTDDAQADLAAIRKPSYGDCVLTSLKADLERQAPGATVADLAAAPLDVEQFGDASVGVRLTANVVYGDHTDRLFVDLVYITKDRSTVSLTFFSFTQPFTPTLEQSLVSRVGHRIAA